MNLDFLGVSPLAFMLGMYLPMEINTPLVLWRYRSGFGQPQDR